MDERVRRAHPELAFRDAFLDRVDEDDLSRHDPDLLDRLAARAFEELAAFDGEPRVLVEPFGPPERRFTCVILVNRDRPFLLDSTLAWLAVRDIDLRFVAHPVFRVERDDDGVPTQVEPVHRDDGEKGERISAITLLLAPQPHEEKITKGLERVLDQVRLATEDWPAMRGRVKQAAEHLHAHGDDGAAAFLEWLLDDNFTFLGTRTLTLARKGGQVEVVSQDEGLGILRDGQTRILRRAGQPAGLTSEVRSFLEGPDPLIVTKAAARSLVHRADYMDYIGAKRWRESGDLQGELRIVGLFTSSAYTRSVSSIPLLKEKVSRVLERADFEPTSHSGKALLNVLERWPRTELFQADADTLFEQTMAALRLTERPRVRVMQRRDRFGRFVSLIVYVPRERYSSDVREHIGEALGDMLGGHVSAFEPDFPEGNLARVHFIIGLESDSPPRPESREIEERVASIARTWTDGFLEEAASAMEGARPHDFAETFPPAYQAAYSPAQAVVDLCAALALRGERRLSARFVPAPSEEGNAIGLRLLHTGAPLPLSERVPLLENMGFSAVNERTHRLVLGEGREVYLHDMLLARADGEPVELDAHADALRAAFMAVWTERVDDDGFNALVHHGLGWRECALLRTLARFVRQSGTTYGLGYMARTLGRYPATARDLTAYFEARFRPDVEDREAAEDAVRQRIGTGLDEVASLDDDRILRTLRDVIDATLRTDFYMLDEKGEPPASIALKIASQEIEALPAPRPYREIFVHAPDVEGVHLRFGPVARGGLRWSDRPQDFRTEVLGLVKAQQVKNAVIVPVGAKGGFVPRRLPAGGSREEIFEAGRAAYVTFVDRLLSLTDDIEGDEVVPPQNVVRHDDDDPYLVVAADKGTATFSDTANGLSEAHGFWLDDAFASGGSAGYDHKAMGITARGAWESVKRHFREMDVDPERDPIVAMGIGDMSGDVFGNGVLLSKSMLLVAAFDHRHIFLDPNSDPQRSWEERKRLFDLPRSSWAEYDEALISKGGGVWARTEKSIPLSSEVRERLGVEDEAMSPVELMRAILKAPSDLFWFGGIGTYVRGPQERDADVGDRANDAVRIAGDELGAKVVGEGANLGLTQRGRIAYALAGGRVNSDAIDNSGGVNSSDVEVNIKIALRPLELSGKLERAKRNELLVAMTPAVADLVLRNNYLQTLAVSLAERRGMAAFPYQVRLINMLERRGLLNRSVETLPEETALAERVEARVPFTRPELGVLLAYAKITLFADLVASDVPDDPYLERELIRYFPPRMQESYVEAVDAHRLRREIIATQLSNAIVNRAGPAVLVRMRDLAAADASGVARAYAAVRDAFDMSQINASIDALDNQVPGAAQLALYLTVQNVLIDRMAWMLRHADFSDGIGAVVERYARALEKSRSAIEAAFEPTIAERVAVWTNDGIPENVAREAAVLPLLAGAADIDLIARRADAALDEAASAYLAVAERFMIDRIDVEIRRFETVDYFQRLALERARRTLAEAHHGLAVDLLANGGDLETLEAQNANLASMRDQVLAIVAEGAPSLAKLTVAAGLLADAA